MVEDDSLDIVGIGKLAEAIPDKAWEAVVTTACSTFEKIVFPLTATTSGVGRLIEAKFDQLVDAEKVLTSQTFEEATKKAQLTNNQRKTVVNPTIILQVLEASSCEVNSTLRELWANLLANELAHGSVHPEFPRILSRMSPGDAQRLAKIVQYSKKRNLLMKFWRQIEKDWISGPALDFTNVHLQNLGLIEPFGTSWKLTVVGDTFIEAVVDPSFDESKGH